MNDVIQNFIAAISPDFLYTLIGFFMVVAVLITLLELVEN